MAAPPAVEKALRADGWLPAAQVARALGVHVSTIYRAASDGKVAGRRVGRAWYVQKASILAYYGNAPEVREALKKRLPAVVEPEA